MNGLIAVAVVLLIPSLVRCQSDAAQQTPPSGDALRVHASKVQIKKKVFPVYPEEAQKKFIQGQVVLDVVIGKDGKVESVRTIRGDSILAKAATEALRQWIFFPFLKDGKPVRVIVSISQSFYLTHPPPFTEYIPLIPENKQSPNQP